MSKRQRRQGEKRRRHGIASRSGRRLAAGAGLAVGATLATGGVAQADDFAVTNLSDDATTPPAGSLREAIADANLHTGADTITFSSDLTGTLTVAGDLPAITDAVGLYGPGPDQVSISGGDAHSLFHFNGSFNATLANLTVRDGHSTGDGGAIDNEGANLHVDNSVISGSTAAGSGGGISSDHYLLLTGSSVQGNSAGGSGGGIASDSDADSQLSLSHAVISGNHASASGGGIDISGNGEGDIYRATIHLNSADGGGGGIHTSAAQMFAGYSTFDANHADGSGGAVRETGGGIFASHQATFSGNSAGASGGALEAESSFFFRQVTIADNSAVISGGGIANLGAGDPHGLYNTIVANGSAPAGPDLVGAFDAQFSLIENTTGAVVTPTVAGSNVTGVDPQLGPLADNGGPTQTRALAATSPAIDKASNAHYSNDQRFLPRGVDLTTVTNSTANGSGEFEHANASDIGAFELQSAPQSSGAPPAAGGSAPAQASAPPAPGSGSSQKKKHKKHKHKHKHHKHKQDR